MMCLFARFLVQSLRHVWLFQLSVEAYQAPLSMGFTRQGHWSGLPFPSPGHLPESGIESPSPELQVDSLPLAHMGSPACLLLNNNNCLFVIFQQIICCLLNNDRMKFCSTF